MSGLEWNGIKWQSGEHVRCTCGIEWPSLRSYRQHSGGKKPTHCDYEYMVEPGGSASAAANDDGGAPAADVSSDRDNRDDDAAVVPLQVITLLAPVLSAALIRHAQPDEAHFDQMMGKVNRAAVAEISDFHNTRSLLETMINPTCVKFHELLVQTGVTDYVAEKFRDFVRDAMVAAADLVLTPHKMREIHTQCLAPEDHWVEFLVITHNGVEYFLRYMNPLAAALTILRDPLFQGRFDFCTDKELNDAKQRIYQKVNRCDYARKLQKSLPGMVCQLLF